MEKNVTWDVIPSKTALQILMKMPNRPLCRMRQTCHRLNDLIQENEKQLGRRSRIGYLFKITNFDDVPLSAEYSESYYGAVKTITDFENRISAISISKLSLSFEQEDICYIRKLAEAFRRMGFSCDTARLRFPFKDELTMVILGSINARSEIQVYYDIQVDTSLLAALRKLPNCSKLSVDSNHTYSAPHYGFLDAIKVFSSISFIKFSNTTMCQFLQDIYDAKFIIDLNEVDFVRDRDYDDEEDNNNENVEDSDDDGNSDDVDDDGEDRDNFPHDAKGLLPPFTIMFKRNDSSDSEISTIPHLIWKIESSHNIVLIAHCSWSTDMMYILENNPCKVFDRLVELLEIRSYIDKENYLSSGQDQQVALLAKAFLTAQEKKSENSDEKESLGPKSAVLSVIPTNIKLLILKKMKNVQVSRMRRTCSAINGLIDDNSKQLASRTGVGNDLKIDKDGKLKFCVHCKSENPDSEDEDDSDHYYYRGNQKRCDHSMSAMSVDDLCLKVCENGNIDRILELLRGEQFSCDTASITCDGISNQTIEILDLIHARKYTQITIISDYHGITNDQYLQMFSLLNTAQNKHMLEINAHYYEPPATGLFNIFKDFRNFECGSFSRASFKSFIWDLHHSQGNLNFTELDCSFKNEDDQYPFDNQKEEFPVMEILFDRSTFKLPQEITKERGYVTLIRKMELGNEKCLIVMEYGRRRRSPYSVDLHFVRRDENAIIELITETLEVDDEYLDVENYLTATKDDRRRLLQDAYCETKMGEHENRESWRNDILLNDVCSSDDSEATTPDEYESYDEYGDFY